MNFPFVFCSFNRNFAREMNKLGRRIGIAWLLLAVFVSMLLAAGLHRHEIVASTDIDCMECIHHVHHSGHLAAASDNVDDCLLCQFIHFVFTVAATTVLAPLAVLKQNRRFFLNSSIVLEETSVHSVRGPPIGSFVKLLS